MSYVVAGAQVTAITPVAWTGDDERSEGWRVVSRARVDFAGGGVANGLLVERNVWRSGEGRPGMEQAVVIWERPVHGGAGRFRLLRV